MNPLGPQPHAVLANLLSGLQTIEGGLAQGQATASLISQFQSLLQDAQASPEIAGLLEGVSLPQEDAATEQVLRRLLGEIKRRLPESADRYVPGTSPATPRPFQMAFPFSSRRPALPPIDVREHVASLDRMARDQPELYGDKASRLAQMRAMDFPIPPAPSTFPSSTCRGDR